MQVWINVSDVVQNNGFIEQHLVEWQSEATVEMMTVEAGQTHDSTDKVEVGQVLLHQRSPVYQQRQQRRSHVKGHERSRPARFCSYETRPAAVVET